MFNGSIETEIYGSIAERATAAKWIYGGAYKKNIKRMNRERLLLSHAMYISIYRINVYVHILCGWGGVYCCKTILVKCRDRYKMMMRMNCVMFEQIIALTLHLSVWVDFPSLDY